MNRLGEKIVVTCFMFGLPLILVLAALGFVKTVVVAMTAVVAVMFAITLYEIWTED